MNNTMVIGAVAVVVIIAAAFLLMNQGAGQTTTQSYTTNPTSTAPVLNSQPTTIASTTSTSGSPAPFTVLLVNSQSLGGYLANADGMTLYTYSSDTPNSGNSACYSSCATNWPIFYVSSISVPPGLNVSDFGTINRTDGTMQVTYKGWPLYFFVGDHSAGQANGNNVGGFKVAVK